MANENDRRSDAKDVQGFDGLIRKSAQVGTLTATDSELKEINKLTLEPLAAEDVFVYKVAICDNDIDRDFEVFPVKSLKKMKSLFLGKTMIKDHQASADNQVARIYATELKASETEVTSTGEVYTQLVAKCYMLNTDANKSLIAEIKGGIKKEVSVGFRNGKSLCSICGVDGTKDYCRHYWGKEYEGQVCHFKLEPNDAYEVSFVAVPAQPKAGTIKMYGAKYQEFDAEDFQDLVNTTEKGIDDKELIIKLMLSDVDAFLFTKNQLSERGTTNHE